MYLSLHLFCSDIPLQGIDLEERTFGRPMAVHQFASAKIVTAPKFSTFVSIGFSFDVSFSKQRFAPEFQYLTHIFASSVECLQLKYHAL